MIKYIDIDAFIADCEQCNFTDIRQVYFALRHQPSIDIVRCEKCKWRGFYRHCRYFRDIDFCSHGEREGE